MRKLWLLLVVGAMLYVSGCGNLSGNLSPRLAPRQHQNIQGKIGEIESDQNSNRMEMLNLKHQVEVQGSELNRVQEGMGNAQNNGTIQILSGPGGLLAVVIVLLGCTAVIIYYHNEAKIHKKAAEIMAQQLVAEERPDIKDSVLKMAMYTDAEETVYKLLKKHESLQSQVD